MTRVLVLNGPNLGRLGSPRARGLRHGDVRRPGRLPPEGRRARARGRRAPDRRRGELLGWLHEAVDAASPVVLNPAAFTHYSYALRDACAPLEAGPLVEVHISNPCAREEFRHTSVVSGWRTGVIAGLGLRLLRARAPGDRAGSRPVGLGTMATTNDLKNGIVLDLDGQLWTVVGFQHAQARQGRHRRADQGEHVLSGKVVDRTFDPARRSTSPRSTVARFSYLYHDGDGFVFMDTTDLARSSIRVRSSATPRTTCSRTTRQRRHSTTASRCTSTPHLGHARGHLHRAGPPGRPFDRRYQAGHPRDRLRDPGPAVPRHRRPRSRSTPATAVTSAASPTQPRTSHLRPPQVAQARARHPVRADIRGVPICRDARRGGRPRRRAAPARVVVAVRPRDRRRCRGPTSGEIDAEIKAYAQGLARLSGCRHFDRAIARLAAWELLYNDEVPDAVAISEAVESGRRC